VHIILSFVFGFFISFSSFRLKLLNSKGAAATFILAVIIFYFGEVKWTIPILIFFILSSLLSKLRRKINPKVDSQFQKSDQRDHVQVLANGGFPALIILVNQVYSSELLYVVYVSALAAACSDTWSTEIGTMFNTRTFDILNLHIVEQGTSGGVSLPGFVGSILGAIIISFSALVWITSYKFLGVIIVSGIIGCIFDSVLGSALQAKYNCIICNKTVERKIHCDKNTVHSKGFKRLDNDGVNFSTSIFGGLVSLLFTVLVT
jgi:uncharacterized protein (TIGR00297 family)